MKAVPFVSLYVEGELSSPDVGIAAAVTVSKRRRRKRKPWGPKKKKAVKIVKETADYEDSDNESEEEDY